MSGTAVRKHWTDTTRRTAMNPLAVDDGYTLRTTLRNPDGKVVIELDEQQGGRGTLKALGITVPPVKDGWWS